MDVGRDGRVSPAGAVRCLLAPFPLAVTQRRTLRLEI